MCALPESRWAGLLGGMFTSESNAGDGLKKLAEYLAQTRRQASASIDLLNVRVSELSADLEIAKQTSEKLEGERDFFRNLSEQLKLENSKKWRLQERDDWKSLVDSVQRDRARLQDECHRLETELEEARAQQTALQGQLQARNGVGVSAPMPSSPTPSAASRFFFGSPIVTSAAGAESPTTTDASPRAVTKQLKLELAKAHAKLQVERASAMALAASHESEISRLKQELSKRKSTGGAIWSRGGSGRSWNSAAGSSAVAKYNSDGAASWMNPIHLFTHFFATSAAMSTGGDLSGVLRV